jgi:hypothetical protein
MANLDGSLPGQKLVYAWGFVVIGISNNSKRRIVCNYRNSINLMSGVEGIADFTKYVMKRNEILQLI